MSSRRLAPRPPSRPASRGASRSAPRGATSAPRGVPITQRNLSLLLLQARESVMARFRPMLNDAGVTEQQWRVLRALLEQGPMEPRAIVEVCRISSPSLAGVLARMDELGLVSRKRIDHDQRRVLVSLTAKSRGLAQRLAPKIEAIYGSIEECVGAEFIEKMYASLDELIATMCRAESESGAAVGRLRR